MKLSRETLADRLFDQLRQQILSGRLAPGDRLPSEREIGEAFGVGRTTVREAVGGLVSAGFVERRGRTLVVRDPDSVGPLALGFATVASRESVQQVYEVRKLVEVHAVRLAALNRTADDLRNLHEKLARMDTDDVQAYHAADPDFHAAIAKASGNEVLYQLFQSASDVFFKLPTFWRVFGSHRQRPRIGSGYRGHAALLEAIEAGDAGLAGERMYALLDKVEKGLVAAILASHVDAVEATGGTAHGAGVTADDAAGMEASVPALLSTNADEPDNPAGG